MSLTDKQHRSILQRIAQRVMLEKGLLPEFSGNVLSELDKIIAPATIDSEQVRDLRNLLWASIDNDDSRDLDQLTVAEMMPGDEVKVLVAVADVDSIVKSRSAIDDHAQHNTTSVYTAAEIFPMLPEKLSTNLTSLNFNEDRPAIVIEMVISLDGSLKTSDIYRAHVRNHAKLAYNSVAAWLEGKRIVLEAITAVNGLAENLRMQDRVAQSMKILRHTHGALSLETIETKPIFKGDEIRDLEEEKKNRAKDIIEDFMIGANGVTARYLLSKKFPSIRRVVRTPKRWDRIVDLAGERGFTLPPDPDAKTLDEFLMKQKETDPLRFPDLSLSVIKLMGAGEYVAELPGDTSPGHFGLAVRDYTHATAPNRRYIDLITQRLLKAAIAGETLSYSANELEGLAKHCTEGEDAANKVERQVSKSAAAILLESRIGERFDALVTGAAPKGTWVRILHPPIEGKLVSDFEHVDVGQRIQVQLIRTDVEHGFIDFKRIG
jgi:VacB/RNase II family 3'-5' exoribonuclease